MRTRVNKEEGSLNARSGEVREGGEGWREGRRCVKKSKKKRVR